MMAPQSEALRLASCLTHEKWGANTVLMLAETCNEAANELRRLHAECTGLRQRAESAELENAKITSDRYPFVHLRMDCSEAEKEGALHNKLIELGWRPPGAPTLPVAFPRCTALLRAQGVAYPRTCTECGLGPCERGQMDGAK